MQVKKDLETPPPDREKIVHEAQTFELKNKQISFRNGKVNQYYEIDFDVEKLDIPEIAEVSFEGLEAFGLQYVPEEKKIKGTPTHAGDHNVVMYFKRTDWTEGKPLLQRPVTFIINPDPKSLWKSIPSEQDATKTDYPKPDFDMDYVKVVSKQTKGVLGTKLGSKTIARKDMVAASQRGRSHALEGKPRDDDFALYFDEATECYIMAVADGAGSAKFSRRGSAIACDTVLDVCKEKLAVHRESLVKHHRPEDADKNEIGKILQDALGNAVFKAYKAIESEAQEKGCPVKDFATTLILSICKKFDYGWFIGAWWVGDGGIGVYRKEPEYLKVLGEPDGGEFAGQTRFLTMPEIISNELYKRIKFDIVEDFTALILMTDGITDPKFETDANLGRIEKWNDLWRDLEGENEDSLRVDFTDDNEQAAGQLLKWLDFWSRGNHDDRTIAILY
jgi:serine/threonine protein phosphatase PrpC